MTADPPSLAPPASESAAGVRAWMEAFAAAVRGRDTAAGRSLFDPAVVAFGTRAGMVAGLDALVENQGRPAWDATRGFAFDPASAHVGVAGELAWAAAEWRSQGRAAGGGWFDRFGRATFVLRRVGGDGGPWRAVHSHFSLDPSRPATPPPHGSA